MFVKVEKNVGRVKGNEVRQENNEQMWRFCEAGRPGEVPALLVFSRPNSWCQLVESFLESLQRSRTPSHPQDPKSSPSILKPKWTTATR